MIKINKNDVCLYYVIECTACTIMVIGSINDKMKSVQLIVKR